jgi:hypothetical protein
MVSGTAPSPWGRFAGREPRASGLCERVLGCCPNNRFMAAVAFDRLKKFDPKIGALLHDQKPPWRRQFAITTDPL